MAYTKTTWVNGPAGGTPINAANLQNIEDGIEALDTTLSTWVNKAFANSGESVVASDKVFVDTTGGAFNLVLPATPTMGNTCTFVDVAGNFNTANFTINVAAGDKLMGVVDDFLLLSTNNDFVTLVYSGATYGWVITNKP